MSGKLIIIANFSVYVAEEAGQPERRRSYSKGQVVAFSEIPEGHTPDSWEAKGLAKVAPAT